MLRDKPPGTFVVRDSNTFQGAFGLALKVAQVPPNVQIKEGGLLLLLACLLSHCCSGLGVNSRLKEE